MEEAKMLYLIPRRFRDKLRPQKLPPPGSLQGQTVLVTGASSGLGLAAARHFAVLGASIIMTARSLAQGEEARRQVQRDVPAARDRIEVVELEMSGYASCVDFVDRLKMSEMGKGGLDVAVLNAGLVGVELEESPEGWEQVIQVNTLSTALLGLLLAAWMRQTKTSLRPKPHLVFVASRDHLDPDISGWAAWSAEKDGILRQLSSDSYPGHMIDPNYANSKLMLMYVVEKMAQTRERDGTPDVIINSVCPGLVRTRIARRMVKQSLFIRIMTPIYLGILGQSSDYGSRFLIKASTTSDEQHGAYIQAILRDDEYQEQSVKNMTSPTAESVKQLVLQEILADLRDKVPGLDEMIAPYSL